MPKHAKRDSGNPGRPKGSNRRPKISSQYSRKDIVRKEMLRVEMHDFSCKCRHMIRPVEMPSLRCGLCGSNVIHPYKHFRLIQPDITEILGDACGA